MLLSNDEDNPGGVGQSLYQWMLQQLEARAIQVKDLE